MWPARLHSDGVPVKRPSVGNFLLALRRIKKAHDLIPATHGPNREPTTNDFSKASQVRPDLVYFLQPPRRTAKGLHFIEDQTILYCRVKLLKSARNCFFPGITPADPSMGSTMIPARSSLFFLIIFSAASMLLYGRTTTLFKKSSLNPPASDTLLGSLRLPPTPTGDGH